MILLYTGAKSADGQQPNANLSLGGYVSNNPVPNGRLANLFSTIAKSDVNEKRSVIRMIVLKNTTSVTKNNLKIYTDVANSHVKLQIAAVAPALDSSNNPVFESVFDGSSLPYQATLDYHEGVSNAILAGDLANNGVIGIWILREIDLSKFPEFTSTATGAELATILEEAESKLDETVSLYIDYD